MLSTSDLGELSYIVVDDVHPVSCQDALDLDAGAVQQSEVAADDA